MTLGKDPLAGIVPILPDKEHCSLSKISCHFRFQGVENNPGTRPNGDEVAKNVKLDKYSNGQWLTCDLCSVLFASQKGDR